MTRRNNARLAGFAYLFYIAVAFPSMVLMSRATSGERMAAKLASVAQHAADVHLVAVLSLLSSCCALALAVSLWSITRGQDPDLAMLGLTCRVAEGVTGAVSIPASLGLLWLATNAPDPASAQTLGGFVLQDSPLVAASFFALGSTLFSWLLLRGRMIPVALAWLGVVASILIVVGLTLQLGGLLRGAVPQLMWLPMAAYEIPLGFWLVFKGVAPLEA